jgi:hypothetical protein
VTVAGKKNRDRDLEIEEHSNVKAENYQPAKIKLLGSGLLQQQLTKPNAICTNEGFPMNQSPSRFLGIIFREPGKHSLLLNNVISGGAGSCRDG